MKTTPGAARRRALPAAAAAAAIGLLTAGCGPAGQPAGTSTTVPGSGPAFGWFAFGTADATGGPPPGPVDAVERADLRLPDRADVRQVETQSAPLGAESYLFVFRVPAQTAAEFCDQGGLGGAGAVRAIPADVAERMHQPPVTAGSRWCAAPAPTDPRWSRHVLIEAGEPSTVYLALYRRP